MRNGDGLKHLGQARHRESEVQTYQRGDDTLDAATGEQRKAACRGTLGRRRRLPDGSDNIRSEGLVCPQRRHAFSS